MMGRWLAGQMDEVNLPVQLWKTFYLVICPPGKGQDTILGLYSNWTKLNTIIFIFYCVQLTIPICNFTIESGKLHSGSWGFQDGAEALCQQVDNKQMRWKM